MKCNKFHIILCVFYFEAVSRDMHRFPEQIIDSQIIEFLMRLAFPLKNKSNLRLQTAIIWTHFTFPIWKCVKLTACRHIHIIGKSTNHSKLMLNALLNRKKLVGKIQSTNLSEAKVRWIYQMYDFVSSEMWAWNQFYFDIDLLNWILL